ncbi:MAG: Asp23/Gls24 family envelope stress response protein [Clostridiales Family XIII bacterium]|jgi:uncharacterized alkaline shock family protein YloU|nr:Asp23/Gls24 family envelope stress response protein [Clostridiales Family XIII bacterium]
MKVFGLIGKSGSGKSYQAINLCRRLGAESILDDGLFIMRNSAVAGKSAKRQDTKIRAIKTALFSEDEHRNAVVQKIKELEPASMLVIGTSEKMVERIVARLGLPEPEELIDIESITTAKERNIAEKQRHELGKHVIPVPSFQLKKDFSGYFVHPLRIILDIRGRRARISDRSVVRPAFSYQGKYTISARAVYDIAIISGGTVEGVESVQRVNTDNGESGITVNISVNLRYGVKVFSVAEALQKRVAEQVGKMTAYNVRAVNVDVKGLR